MSTRLGLQNGPSSTLPQQERGGVSLEVSTVDTGEAPGLQSGGLGLAFFFSGGGICWPAGVTKYP